MKEHEVFFSLFHWKSIAYVRARSSWGWEEMRCWVLPAPPTCYILPLSHITWEAACKWRAPPSLYAILLLKSMLSILCSTSVFLQTFLTCFWTSSFFLQAFRFDARHFYWLLGTSFCTWLLLSLPRTYLRVTQINNPQSLQASSFILLWVAPTWGHITKGIVQHANEFGSYFWSQQRIIYDLWANEFCHLGK